MFCLCLHCIHTLCLQRQDHQELVLWIVSQHVDTGSKAWLVWKSVVITEIFLQLLILLFIDHSYAWYMCGSQDIRTGCLFLPVCAFCGWNSGPQACRAHELFIFPTQMLSKVDWWGNVSVVRWQLDQLDKWRKYGRNCMFLLWLKSTMMDWELRERKNLISRAWWTWDTWIYS